MFRAGHHSHPFSTMQVIIVTLTSKAVMPGTPDSSQRRI